MKLNKAGIDIMHEFEGLELESYLCPAGVPTIGYGNTRYESGRKVKLGESITKERAELLFNWWVDKFAIKVRKELKVTLNENQFSALVSFTYNVGIANLRSSTLLKKVNANLKDTTIFGEFLKWKFAAGKASNGLIRRRQSEAELYFTDV